MDEVDFSRSRLSKSFQNLVHLGFNRVVFPVGIGRLLQMVLDPMQATVQLGQSAFQDLFARFDIFHVVNPRWLQKDFAVFAEAGP